MSKQSIFLKRFLTKIDLTKIEDLLPVFNPVLYLSGSGTFSLMKVNSKNV